LNLFGVFGDVSFIVVIVVVVVVVVVGERRRERSTSGPFQVRIHSLCDSFCARVFLFPFGYC